MDRRHRVIADARALIGYNWIVIMAVNDPIPLD
jgi:hypothetical protein